MQSENNYNSILEEVKSQASNTAQAPRVGDKVWQFIRFAVVTGIIFAVSFFVMNFHAYKSILSSILDPAAQAQKSDLLTNAAGNTLDQSALLPVLNEEKDTNTSYAWLDFPVVPTDNRLVVPRLGKSVPIVEMDSSHLIGQNWPELENQIQGALQNGVVHYPTTAVPGLYGNVFITGHSSYYPWDPGRYKDVFALLNDVQIGDEYYIYYQQKQYKYKVTNKFLVDPKDTTVLDQPKDKLMSTLMTCYPVGTTQSRLIIQADQVMN